MAMDDTNGTVASANNDDPNDRNDAEPPAPEDVSGNTEERTNNEVGTIGTSSENFTVPASAVERVPSRIKCQFLPHGVYAVIPALLSMFAWFACLSKDGCDYARVTGPIVAEITNNPLTPYIDAGLSHYREPTFSSVSGEWFLDFTLPCQEYNTAVVDIDGAWGFAKITSFLTLVFGGGGSLFIWFSSCFIFSKNTWRWAGYEILAATTFAALSYTWFATSLCHGSDGQDKCAMHYGARADFLACIFWAISVLLIFCKYPGEIVSSQSDAVQQPPPELEMSDQSGERRAGIAVDEHEII